MSHYIVEAFVHIVSMYPRNITASFDTSCFRLPLCLVTYTSALLFSCRACAVT